MSRAALLTAGVLLALALAILLSRPAGQTAASAFDRFAKGRQQLNLAPPATPSSLPPPQLLPANEISHKVPPDPRLLSRDAARQATFDNSAGAGEFVTPPTVSIEH